MLKILKSRQTLLCVTFPTLINEVDFEKYKEARGLHIVDPWERVKTIFLRDDFGKFHPELINTLHMAQYGILLGFLVGGLKESRKELENFLRTNDANIYANQRQGYRALNNHLLLAAIKGGMKFGLPFAIFAGSFSFLCSCCELYRNKVGIIEKVIAGASCGAFYRFMFGIKGMISGSLLGGILGGIYGVSLWAVCKITKTNQLELKYVNFAFSQYLKERKRSKNYFDEEDEKIIKSGLHAKHTPDPLDFLEVGEDKMNFNKKQNT